MNSLQLRIQVDLPPDPASAGQARKLLADLCAAAQLDEDRCAAAALLTSELVTNAIRYGGSRFTLEATIPGPCLRVTVLDASSTLPTLESTPSVTAEGGRGLQLVEMLASRWGVETRDAGKAVWFELDVTAP